MTKKFNLYLGKAGQLVVMAEFLCRGWNVATPEVDVGDDIFVVRDSDGEFARVQVKTATAVGRKDGFSAQFTVDLSQLKQDVVPELTYVFAVRFQRNWVKPVVIRRNILLQFFRQNNVGSATKDSVNLYFSYQSGKVTCSGTDFKPFLDNFDGFPLIEH